MEARARVGDLPGRGEAIGVGVLEGVVVIAAKRGGQIELLSDLVAVLHAHGPELAGFIAADQRVLVGLFLMLGEACDEVSEIVVPETYGRDDAEAETR